MLGRLADFSLDSEDLQFRDAEALSEYLYALEGVEVRNIGFTKERSEMHGLRFGHGPAPISIIAGCHADEPVGPMTAQLIARVFGRHFPELLDRFSFHVIPQMNPEAAHRNFRWFADPVELPLYLNSALRELPGDDIEFGFGVGPAVRAENLLAMSFLKKYGPYAAHFSLHGMGFAEGAWCLICHEWAQRAGPYMAAFASLCEKLRYPLHDVDRMGEKGFNRIRPGFCTTPTSDGMRSFFRGKGDKDTARKFMPNSMEWVRSLGGDPVCVVTELPLFTVGRRSPSLEEPTGAALREDLMRIRRDGDKIDPEAVDSIVDRYRLEPTPLELQVRLQVAMVVLTLTTLIHPSTED